MILKFINGKNSNLNQLKDVIEYVRDDNKTNPELMSGYCCDCKYPFEDMSIIKKLHKKEHGKQYEHFIVSFDPEDDLSNDTALNIIKDIAKINKNNQSFCAIHNNTAHLHAHVIMNSVDCNGKKFSQWKPKLNEFKRIIDNQICHRYDIKPISRTSGSKPVDDLNLLEFTTDELLLGGYTMNHNSELYLPAQYEGNDLSEYEYDYDYDYNYDDDHTDNSKTCHRKGVFLGNTYNIKLQSMKELDKLKSSSLTHNESIDLEDLKLIMNYLGDDIDYHIGNTFYISIEDKPQEPTVKDPQELWINPKFK